LSPRRVRFGIGSSASTADELVAAGVRPGEGRVVLVGDAAILELDLAAPVIGSLEAAGYVVDVRPGVAAEPTPDAVAALVPTSPGSVAVVGVGGGSALDAAKLTALAIPNEVDLHGGLTSDREVTPAPPLIAIPTTAGTGAEVTPVAMLWDHGRKVIFVHGALVPEVALLDPDLLASLPPSATAAGGLDAISHAVESLLSTFSTPLTEAAARSALAQLVAGVPAAYANGCREAREATLLGAHQAGLALNASVVLGHSMAYAIAAEAQLPHGVSCAMALPYCLAHCRPVVEPRIAAIAEIVCGPGAAPLDLVEWLISTNDELGIPGSLEAVGIGADALDRIARACVEDYPRPNHPRPIELDDVRALLGDFQTGDAISAWRREAVAA
jgi:alcohol dehydrogenase class IV